MWPCKTDLYLLDSYLDMSLARHQWSQLGLHNHESLTLFLLSSLSVIEPIYDETHRKIRIPFDDLQHHMLIIVIQFTQRLIARWSNLFSKVASECDRKGRSFLKSDRFVHLLYDDVTFTQSRF